MTGRLQECILRRDVDRRTHCIRCQIATGIDVKSTARDFGNERVVRIETDSCASEGLPRDLDWVKSKSRHLDCCGCNIIRASQDSWKWKLGRRWHQRSSGETNEATHGQASLLRGGQETPQNGCIRPLVRVAPPGRRDKQEKA